MTKKLKFTEYTEAVLNYLEYMGWDDYLMGYDPANIAHCLHECNKVGYEMGLSVRLTALINFGVSLNAIKRHAVSEKVKH